MSSAASPQGGTDIQKELRAPFLVLLLVVPLLAIAGWHVHGSVASDQDHQRLLRTAQIERARILRFQLDEETGVRGYVETKDVLYLEPYKKATQLMSPSMAALDETLNALKVGMSGYVEEQSRRNATWIATVARPLIARPEQNATTRELERRDKQIVDDYRNADQLLVQRLDSAANAADADARRALDNTLAYLIGSTILIALGSVVFGFIQARTAREALQNLLLFKGQKQIADALQAAFLNRNLPISPTIGLHASYVPATLEMQVGGDWYDAFELPNGRILFSIGDVAGHGLEAAVVMSRARQAIIAASLGAKDPAQVLQRANESIMLQDSRMVTAICGYIDPATLEVTYATAGHPAPVLARAGEPAYFLPQGGIALGVLRDATFQTYVAQAFDGALIVLYTDGVIEHKRDIIDGERRLLDASRMAADDENPALAIQRLMFADSPATDDVAIMTISFKQGQPGVQNMTTVGGLQVNSLEVPGFDGRGDTALTDLRPEIGPNQPNDIDRQLRVLLRSKHQRNDDTIKRLSA